MNREPPGEPDAPLTAPRGWFTPENIAPFIAPIKAVHHRLIGPEAALSSIPLAVMRAFFGDDYTVRIRRKPFTVNLHDTIVSFEIMMYKAWQPLETIIYERLIRPGDRVIDVGANIGYFTVLFAELVGDAGHVLAIEPEPNNIRLLRKNVAARGLSGIVTVAETAVGATTGSAKLYTAASGNLGDNRMYYTPERHGLVSAKERGVREVALERVDVLAADRRRADFVKMDIQGYEAHALRGMTAVIEASPEMLLFTEFFPFGMRGAGSDPFAFLAALRSYGFEIWETASSDPTLRPVTDDRRFIERVEPDRGEANLLCARGEGPARRVGRLAGRCTP